MKLVTNTVPVITNGTFPKIHLGDDKADWSEVETLNTVPAFTQAMADAGELPIAGSEAGLRCISEKSILVTGTVLYASEVYCIITQDGGELVKYMKQYTYEPIDTRTDKQKAVDKMYKIIDTQDSYLKACEIIYDMLVC